jgi:electron transport complex protein RnfE
MSPKMPTPLVKEFTKGIIRENPILRLILGTCPTLALTTSVRNGVGMGIAATFVLLGSNLVIAALRKVIPDKVRIPAFITIIAGFVTIVQMLMQTYLPDLNAALGIYIPLITVNCIILARAEMFASKNSVFRSILDALGMGVGYTAAMFIMSSIREIIGNGTFLGMALPMISKSPMLILILPPGGFFIFGILVAVAQWLSETIEKRSGGQDRDFCSTAEPGTPACQLCGGCNLGVGGLNREINAGFKSQPAAGRSDEK